MAGKAKSKANSKVRIADNGYKFPEQLPVGEKLIDSVKNEWIIGNAIARGGFGEIYEARPFLIKSNLPSIKNNKDYEYVVKVDHLNGPLFCEMNFYIRAAKLESILNWTREKGLKFLGVPAFIATGTHNKGDIAVVTKKTTNISITRYRFLVMPRFGSDLQSVLKNNNLKLPLDTVYTIGIKIIDSLEYIHSQGYVHADIKAQNLLLSYKTKLNELHDEIWLVDFGLVEKYLQVDSNKHKPHGEDLRKANNGTIEFTSRDAHIGCFTRKGDMEILAYNLLSWLSGARLPWMRNLTDKNLVKNLKNNYMDRLDDLLNYAFENTKCETVTTATKRTGPKTTASNKTIIPDGIAEFFRHVIKMRYDEKPDYRQFKSILEKALLKNGYPCDGKYYLGELSKASNESTSRRISPLKRKLSSYNKKSSGQSIDYSEISVIFDETEEEDDDIAVLPSKKSRKASSNGIASNGNLRNGRKSPIVPVLNAKFASNGRNKNSQTNNSTSHKQSPVPNSQLLNENGINKLNNELNDDQIDTKSRRRNPSRKVKNIQVNENSKLLNGSPIKNGQINKLSSYYDKSENHIIFQGKILTNPTPAMIDLLDRVNKSQTPKRK